MALSAEGGERKWLGNWAGWVEACTAKHAGRYTYPSSKRRRDKYGRWQVRVICPDHGEFWQAPEKHRFGRGCPRCNSLALPKDAMGRLAAAFPELSLEGIMVTGSKAPLTLVCREHGAFETNYNRLMNKAAAKPGLPACPKCARLAGGGRKHRAAWERDFHDVFGDRYEYDWSTLINASTKMRVVCKEHGEFWALPQDMRTGRNGCPACAASRRYEWSQAERKLGADDILIAAFTKKGGRYLYNVPTLTGMRDDMQVVCLQHGAFWQRPGNHIHNDAECPKCAGKFSKGEAEVAGFLRDAGVEVVQGDRRTLGGLELDIWVPELNVAVEYCGLYWHSENLKGVDYHLDKLEKAKAAGIRLVQVFEDEWLERREAVETRLLHLVGGSYRMSARKLELVHIGWAEAKSFYDRVHTQGAGTPSGTNYGLRNGATLVACMSFGPSRFGPEVEMLRFASTCSVAGGFSRLLKAYLRSHPESGDIVTYADRRWSDGAVYGRHGFVSVGTSKPSYFWCKGTSRLSRLHMQKHKLPKVLERFDESMTEVENCYANGYWRVFDCGTSKWVLKRS